MTGEDHYRALARMYLTARTNEYYRPTLTIREGEAEIVVPIRDDFFHAADAVHGSVYFKLLDDVAYFAVNSIVEDVLVLTASFQIDLLRPVADGELRAEGILRHRSRRRYLADSQLFDTDGNLVARGSGTFMRSEIELGPDVGYR